jgi:signal transduction histidine kinase
MMSVRPLRRHLRTVVRIVLPILLWCGFIGLLVSYALHTRRGDEQYDDAALQEWVEESRVFRETLPQLVRDYRRKPTVENASKLQAHLAALGDVTKMYAGQLPLFPTVYRLELQFVPESGEEPLEPIVWESQLPRRPGRFAPLPVSLHDDQGRHIATLSVYQQLHAYNFKRQQEEQAYQARVRWAIGLAAGGTALAFIWVYLVQRTQAEREHQRALARQQLDEAERKLLEQRLATQAAERQALELKSRLYASIGIMAGSYAHNIKNLLVRPNDLLRRCLEADGLSSAQEQMLREARETLGTVTERLQQILRTVRRDPSRSETVRLDLNDVVRELQQTWEDLGREKWKLTLTAELAPGPLEIEGDRSHLQQAFENLLFNARDATFEMRNHLRSEAHLLATADPQERRQALIGAAAWRGQVVLRTVRDGDRAILEVVDNGIGMTTEVRRRCTETHFSTKRDNAVYEGNTTGMGLGLSFVVTILEHHHATLEIRSEPLRGALFRVSFPPATVTAEKSEEAAAS